MMRASLPSNTQFIIQAWFNYIGHRSTFIYGKTELERDSKYVYFLQSPKKYFRYLFSGYGGRHHHLCQWCLSMLLLKSKKITTKWRYFSFGRSKYSSRHNCIQRVCFEFFSHLKCVSFKDGIFMILCMRGPLSHHVYVHAKTHNTNYQERKANISFDNSLLSLDNCDFHRSCARRRCSDL